MPDIIFDIFISYKRKSLATANNLYYRLTTRGYSTFYDLDEMRKNDFDVQIYNYIHNAKDVFVLLEEGSLDACRNDWRGDWFCKEIAFALQEGKNIIPVLLNGFQMPDEEFFPDELKGLCKKNAPEFSYSFFDAYIDRIIAKGYITSVANVQKRNTSVIKFFSSANCVVMKEGKTVCSLIGQSKEPFYLPMEKSGEYVFQCFKNSNDNINFSGNPDKELLVSIEDNTEKVVRINWGFDYAPQIVWLKRHILYILIGVLIIGTLISFGLLRRCNSVNHHLVANDSIYQKGECVSQLFLMRYKDINTYFNNEFSDTLLYCFQYEDSIDSNGVTHIFPQSKYLSFKSLNRVIYLSSKADSIPYHFPIIGLNITNKQDVQVNFTQAFLEVMDYRIDDIPVCRFSIEGNNLIITNETDRTLVSNLKYTMLRDEESFVRYANELNDLTINDQFTVKVSKGNLLALWDDSYVVKSSINGLWFNQKLPNLDVQTININNKDIEKNRFYEIKRINATKEETSDQFDRNIPPGQSDCSTLFFAIRSNVSCEIKIRIKLVSQKQISTKKNRKNSAKLQYKYLYSDPIVVKIFIPRTGVLTPEYK